MNTTVRLTALSLGVAVVLAVSGLSTKAAERPAASPRPERPADRVRPPVRDGINTETLVAPPGDLMRLGQQLDLTDQQKETIRKLANSKLGSTRPLLEQIPPLHKQLADAMLSSTPDAAAAKDLVARINSIRLKVAEIGIDFWVQARAQLTPEQNAKLTELLRERTRRPLRSWQGPGRPGPGQPGTPPPGGPMPPPGAAPDPDPGL